MRSTDGGKSWAPFGAGLPDGSVWSLVIDGNGVLFAGTDEGVYRAGATAAQ